MDENNYNYEENTNQNFKESEPIREPLITIVPNPETTQEEVTKPSVVEEPMISIEPIPTEPIRELEVNNNPVVVNPVNEEPVSPSETATTPFNPWATPVVEETANTVEPINLGSYSPTVENEIDEAPVIPQAPVEPFMANPNLGNMEPMNAQTLENGIGVNPPQGNGTNTQPPKTNNKKVTNIIVILLVLAVAITFVTMYFLKNSSENKGTAKNSNTNNSEVSNNADNDVSESVEQTATDNTTITATEWTSLNCKIDGNIYQIGDSYSKFKDNGWSFKITDYGYEEDYTISPSAKVTSTIKLANANYERPYFYIGLTNLGTEDISIYDGTVWSISVDNSYSGSNIPFELPGGLKNGSTKDDVIKAYGETENVTVSDEFGYTTYRYQTTDYKILELKVYDDKGLVEFDLKQY